MNIYIYIHRYIRCVFMYTCKSECLTSGSQQYSPGDFHDLQTTFLGLLALGVLEPSCGGSFHELLH